MDKAFYFSGIQGSGKTTLIYDLLRTNDCFYKLTKIEFSEEIRNSFDRVLIRLGKYHYEHSILHPIELENNKIGLGDRCIFDTLIHLDTFLKLNWISEIEYKLIISIYSKIFNNNNLPKIIIFLNPQLKWVLSKIKKRGEINNNKWQEEDKKYLSALKQEYYYFYKSLKNNKDFQVYSISILDREKRVAKVKNIIETHVLKLHV